MRLTPLAKAFVTLVILATVGFITWHHLHSAPGPANEATPEHEHDHDHNYPARGKSGPITVGINEFGGAYPGIVANGGMRTQPSSRFAGRGLQVTFKLIRDPRERLAAFSHGELDVLLLTVDTLASLAPEQRDAGHPLRAFLLADWSRGNLGIAASPRIHAIEDLAGARLTTTRNGPSFFFLLMMLQDANLSPAGVQGVRKNVRYATTPAYAAEMFSRGDVDAVATWEPYLSRALSGGKGRLLVSTAVASNLIADVLCARESFLREREADLIAFTRAWLEGLGDIPRAPQASLSAFAAATGLGAEEAAHLVGTIKLARFADNREFFGLEHEDALFLDLFHDASAVWQREGTFKEPVDAGQARWLHALEAVAPEHAGEKVEEGFAFKAGAKRDAAPLLTKTVTIYFPSGGAELDAQDRATIDRFVEELEEFGNAYVRVEGHTDSVGRPAFNLALSQRRAQAVVDDLVKRHGLDPARFQVTGHGADRPRGDNATAAGRDLNRRTDFMIVPNN